ncbi:MFS transporter [Atopomonas sediminilitoris]|uniref:MFS transporter n=1 Tax=Atopomonas sediminilitoris TaxID=2919919 RepID=UPI001F4EE5FE|nr:MFS transporter [Atopomonas sediminilitoris]MCJ8167726.1 MFS transporter [Atopomonas sediminilitoris]
MAAGRQAWVTRLLLVCGFLFVFTETLLAPFYPQFFQRVFAVADLEITGQYIALCRFTVLLGAPLWGLLARRFDPLKLLIIGQGGAAVFTLLCAFVDNLQQFVGLSVLLLLCKSSYLLFYTLLIQLCGGQRQAQVVGSVQAVVHLALISSTAASAWLIQWDNPLQLFVLAAGLDVLQIVLCVLVMHKRGAAVPAVKAEQAVRVWSWRAVWAFAAAILLFNLAANVVRPYFTLFGQQTLALSEWQAAVAFFLPSLMVLACMPLVPRWCQVAQRQRVFSLSVGLMALSLLAQALSDSFVSLLVARLLFGATLLLAQASLELHLFEGAGADVHWQYSLASVVQNLAQLIAPLLAASLVAWHSLNSPFLVAALVLLLTLLIAHYWVFAAAKAPQPVGELN